MAWMLSDTQWMCWAHNRLWFQRMNRIPHVIDLSPHAENLDCMKQPMHKQLLHYTTTAVGSQLATAAFGAPAHCYFAMPFCHRGSMCV